MAVIDYRGTPMSINQSLISMPVLESYMEQRRTIAGGSSASVPAVPKVPPGTSTGSTSLIMQRRAVSPMVVHQTVRDQPLRRTNSVNQMPQNGSVRRSQSMVPVMRNRGTGTSHASAEHPMPASSREQPSHAYATKAKARVTSPRAVQRFVTQWPQASAPGRSIGPSSGPAVYGPLGQSPLSPGRTGVSAQVQATHAPTSPGRPRVFTSSDWKSESPDRRREALKSPSHGYRSPAAPAPAANIPAYPQAGACATCDLQIGQQPFDPNQQPMKSMLLSRLGVGPHSVIECHPANHGGLNDGVWFVRDPAQPSQNLVLKLVSAQRGEGDMFAKLASSHSGIIFDQLLTFPYVIFNCLGPSGEKRYDLEVMRRAPGVSLAEFIAAKHFAKQQTDIMRCLHKVGSCLRELHTKYNDAQHGDFQTSNIFYDEASGKVTFIDFAGMGPKSRFAQSDYEFFIQSLRICATIYGPQLLADGTRHFENGYKKMKI